MRIFVINLQRAKARRKQVEKNLLQHGLSNFEFFEAIDGTDIPADLVRRVDENLMLKRQGRLLSPGEIGCALSHSLVYERIVAEGLEEAVILEDDAVVGSDFFQLLQSGEFSHSGFNMILLHVIHPRVLRWPIKRSALPGAYYKLVSRTYGATAYYLTNKGARRLLAASQKIARVADWPVPIHHWMDTVCYYPFPVFPKYDQAIDSAIEQDRAVLMASLEKVESTKPRGLERLLSFVPLFRIWRPQKYGRMEDYLQDLVHSIYCQVYKFLGIDLPWRTSEGWPDSRT